ncbi:MAG: hypothetical protein H6619_00450 [Deltaproteobacteria bacterium]|nr:hypothetical protein [Deltaproteobacteria bacterium]
MGFWQDLAEVIRLAKRTFYFLLSSTLYASVAYACNTIPLETFNPHNEPGPVFSIGVALPVGCSPDVNQMVVKTLNGTALPTDVHVTTRRGGPKDDTSKPIHWVLVNFKGYSSADNYELHFGQTPPTGELSISSSNSIIEVFQKSNQQSSVQFSTNSMGFGSVKRNGVEIISSADFTLKHHDLVTPLVVNNVTTEVYQAGDVRTVVVQTGEFSTPDGPLAVDVEYTFYSGKEHFDVSSRIMNEGPFGGPNGSTISTIAFDNLTLDITPSFQIAGVLDDLVGVVPFNGQTYRNVQEQVLSYNDGTPSNPQSFNWQSFWNDFQDTSMLISNSAGVTALAGTDKYDSAFIFGDALSSTPIQVAMHNYWEMSASAFEADQDSLKIELWATEGNGPEMKTTNIFPFHSGTLLDSRSTQAYILRGASALEKSVRISVNDFRDNQEFKNFLSEPPVGRQSPKSLNEAQGFGDLFFIEEDFSQVFPSDPVYQTAMNRVAQLRSVITDTNSSDQLPNGKYSLWDVALIGGDTASGGQWKNGYGFLYGSFTWGDGATTHYSITAAGIEAFYGGGSIESYYAGKENVRYHRDYGQSHAKHTDNAYKRGGDHYEKGFQDRGNYFGVADSHTFPEALSVWYLTTGDRRAYEGLEEYRDFYFANGQDNWSGWWGSRIPGWTLIGLDWLILAGVPGADDFAQDVADRIVFLMSHPVSPHQQADAGFILNPGYTPDGVQSWMQGILTSGMARIARTLGTSAYDTLIAQMRDRILDMLIIDMNNPLDGSQPLGVAPAMYTYWNSTEQGSSSTYYGTGPNINHLSHCILMGVVDAQKTLLDHQSPLYDSSIDDIIERVLKYKVIYPQILSSDLIPNSNGNYYTVNIYNPDWSTKQTWATGNMSSYPGSGTKILGAFFNGISRAGPYLREVRGLNGSSNTNPNQDPDPSLTATISHFFVTDEDRNILVDNLFPVNLYELSLENLSASGNLGLVLNNQDNQNVTVIWSVNGQDLSAEATQAISHISPVAFPFSVADFTLSARLQLDGTTIVSAPVSVHIKLIASSASEPMDPDPPSGPGEPDQPNNPSPIIPGNPSNDTPDQGREDPQDDVPLEFHVAVFSKKGKSINKFKNRWINVVINSNQEVLVSLSHTRRKQTKTLITDRIANIARYKVKLTKKRKQRMQIVAITSSGQRQDIAFLFKTTKSGLIQIFKK